MLVSWALLDDLADGEQVLSKSLPHIWELVRLELVQTRDDVLDQDLGVQEASVIREPPDSGSSDLRLCILEELAVVGGKILLGAVDTDAVGDLHYFVSHKISNSPGFIDCKFLDVWDQALINLILGKSLREVNAAVDSLHPHRVLIVLVEIAKDLEQILLWHQWYQLYHVVQNEGRAFSNLRDLVLRGLGE